MSLGGIAIAMGALVDAAIVVIAVSLTSARTPARSVLVAASGGQRQIPLSQLATIKPVIGPSMIRNEDGLLTGYVYVDLAGRDPSMRS
jgi:Cu/Ag efflux pump CusA